LIVMLWTVVFAAGCRTAYDIELANHTGLDLHLAVHYNDHEPPRTEADLAAGGRFRLSVKTWEDPTTRTLTIAPIGESAIGPLREEIPGGTLLKGAIVGDGCRLWINPEPMPEFPFW
jgi:hypothetical protein